MANANSPTFLVRAQGTPRGMHVNDVGDLVLHRGGREFHRNTTHFSVNGVVGNHAYGQFNGGLVIIADPREMDIPSGFGQSDVWFHNDASGDLNVGKARVFAPVGMELPSGIDVTYYSPEPGAREAHVNEYLESKGVTPQVVGMWGWANGSEGQSHDAWRREVTAELYGAAGARIHLGPHAGSPDEILDDALNRCGGNLRAASQSYLWPTNDGADRNSTDVVAEAVAEARSAIERVKQSAAPSVLATAQHYLVNAERYLQSVEKDNAALVESYAAPYTLRDHGGQSHGPFDFDSLEQFAASGAMNGSGDLFDRRHPDQGWTAAHVAVPELAKYMDRPAISEAAAQQVSVAGSMAVPPPLADVPRAATLPPPLPLEAMSMVPPPLPFDPNSMVPPPLPFDPSSMVPPPLPFDPSSMVPPPLPFDPSSMVPPPLPFDPKSMMPPPLPFDPTSAVPPPLPKEDLSPAPATVAARPAPSRGDVHATNALAARLTSLLSPGGNGRRAESSRRMSP